MASLFYSRYIPPASAAVDVPDESEHDNSRPAKKRKKTSKAKIGFNPTAAGEQANNVDVADTIQGIFGVNLDDDTRSNQNQGKARTLKNANYVSLLAGDSNIPSPTRELEKVVDPKLEKKKKPKKKLSKSHSEVSRQKITPSNDDQEPSELEEPQHDNKHRKIRSKFEQSASAAAKMKDKYAAESQVIAKLPDHDITPIESHGLVPLPQPPEVPDVPVRFTLSALPDWLAQPLIVSTSDTASLDSLPLRRNAASSLKIKGYDNVLAIQATVLPMLLQGPRQHSGDVCISAATGSGKTLAYALPMVENLRDKPVVQLRGLVVVPTRELVSQVRETLELCNVGSGLKIGTAVGSRSLKEEQGLLVQRWQRYDPDAYRTEQEKEIDEDEELMNWDFDDLLDETDELGCSPDHIVDYRSEIDILICTPGRLVDHMQSTKGFTLEHVQWLVIDEADRLLDESFQQWIDIVVPALDYQAPLQPWEEQLTQTFHILRRREVRKVILSATMTRDISKLTALKLRKPKLVVLESGRTTDQKDDQPALEQNVDQRESFELPPTLKESAISIKNVEDKPLHLIALLEREHAFAKPLSSLSPERSKGSVGDESTSSSGEDDSSEGSTSSSESSTPPSKRTSKTNTQRNLVSSTHGTLIFTTTNESALRLSRLLSLLLPTWTPHIATLTKSTTTASTRRLLSSFRTRKLSVLIASDRASRGLDIQGLAHVINYDMPTSVTSYVHRVGRTARAGKEGRATTLVGWHEGRWFWGEIGRGEGIRRGVGRKVVRLESKLEGVGGKERREYEEALRILGMEARGERE
jgi:ATP-dependent RNA helicase DDX51/DBP6